MSRTPTRRRFASTIRTPKSWGRRRLGADQSPRAAPADVPNDLAGAQMVRGCPVCLQPRDPTLAAGVLRCASAASVTTMTASPPPTIRRTGLDGIFPRLFDQTVWAKTAD